MSKHTLEELLVEDCKIYIRENAKEISEYIDDEFARHGKEDAMSFIKDLIADTIRDNPTHYAWQDDDCPYDRSGVIVPDGKISMNQTIGEFLADELSGTKRSSHVSGCGWHYENFDEYLGEDTYQYAADFAYDRVADFVRDQTTPMVTDDQLEEATRTVFDCLTPKLIDDFASAARAAEALGIANELLIDVCHTNR